ncbi:hypothetical protein VKS41_002527 [Umbelopsis sp. WA50703]
MSKVQRRRRQGEKRTVSDGEEGNTSEKIMDASSATASTKSDLSTKSSDADSPHSQPATADGNSTPIKTTSTPTRSTRSMFEFHNKNHGKGAGKAQARKQAGPPCARSESGKSSIPKSAPAKVHADAEDASAPESDGSVAVINYSSLEESESHAAESPKRDNHKFERRNRRGRWNDEQHPKGSAGPYNKDKSNFGHRGGKVHTPRRPSSRQFDRQVTTPAKQDNSHTDDLETLDKATATAESTNEMVSPSTPSPEYFHRGGYRGRSRGDQSFHRGRGGYGRRSFRGGYRGNSRPGYIPPSQETEPIKKLDDVDQLAENMSEATLVSPPEDHVTKQSEAADTDETKQARLDAIIEAKRELKREKNKKRRQAKRLSMRAAERQSDGRESVQDEASKPESEPLKTTKPGLPLKTKKVNKSRKPKLQSEKQSSESTEQSTLDKLAPSPESKAVPSKVAPAQADVSSSTAEPAASDIDEKPKRERKLNKDNNSSTAVPQPIANTDQQAPKTSTTDDGLENQSKDTSTSEIGHHRSNSKRYPSRMEDSARLPHARNDNVPMPQQMPPSVSTPSFVSQPVAFALASPNGGPIPVYSMPFQAMNPAMGDVQGGVQGMFYAPMMGSPAAAVSTSSSAPVPQPTRVDPNNMMYMPYDSQQMLMYNPYWYQAMAQQAIPPPNQVWNAANGQPVEYSNWKPAGPDRPHNDSNYPITTAPGVAYNQHGEQMVYPNDHNNGPQAVYYYPVSY